MFLIPVNSVSLNLSRDLEKANAGPYCYECGYPLEDQAHIDDHGFEAGCYHPNSAVIDQMGLTCFFCGDCREWYSTELDEDGEVIFELMQ
jgi:hypothetical protein